MEGEAMDSLRPLTVKCDAPGCINGYVNGTELCYNCHGNGELVIERSLSGVRARRIAIAIMTVIIGGLALLIAFFHAPK
jgi:hypothetical protein